MGVLNVTERKRLRQLYAFCCGYCGITEDDSGTELTEDHFQPVSRGGANDFANIVYACHTCNEFKKDYWNPAGIERILHPLNDDLSLHLQTEADGTLTPLNEVGKFHIGRLRLNRPTLVAYRRRRIIIERNEARIATVENDISEIRALLTEILRRLP